MKIKADFTKTTATVKPMHAVGQPPLLGARDTLFHYLTEAGIPYSRLHDVGGMFGVDVFVDIPNIFRDFDADVTDPKSYDFTFTDNLIKQLIDAGCIPFYRLGVTIENYMELKAYRIHPPKDPYKWARICEHIIKHYNEGWADGFCYGLEYWEIWNEPENRRPETNGNQMWTGTMEEFFELYDITAKHLKSVFGDTIKVGGYGSCGFYAGIDDPELKGYPNYATGNEYRVEFAHRFLEYVQRSGAPLEFFSWHSYHSVEDTVKYEKYCRRLLEKYGFENVPDMLNEWNVYHTVKNRSTPDAAAHTLAMMLAMQKEQVYMLNYYDARIGRSPYGGMFNPDTYAPYLTYYAFMAFNELYKLKNEVFTESDDKDVYVGGASGGKRKCLLIANTSEEDKVIDLELRGVDPSDCEIVMLSDVYSYSPTGKTLKDNKLQLPSNSFAQIRFFD
ncbi:MAG: hypothetical protein IKL92_03260 [Oscillospiraceae bacterium]|nr:hypothetical protein [Oscillospiraceae bacterium]